MTMLCTQSQSQMRNIPKYTRRLELLQHHRLKTHHRSYQHAMYRAGPGRPARRGAAATGRKARRAVRRCAAWRTTRRAALRRAARRTALRGDAPKLCAMPHSGAAPRPAWPRVARHADQRRVAPRSAAPRCSAAHSAAPAAASCSAKLRGVPCTG